MIINAFLLNLTDGPPYEYKMAMENMELRAARGEILLAQSRREIFELRERFATGEVGVIMQWAAQVRPTK